MKQNIPPECYKQTDRMALTLSKTVRHRMGRRLDEDVDGEDHEHLHQGCKELQQTMFDSRRDPCVQEKIFIVLQLRIGVNLFKQSWK